MLQPCDSMVHSMVPTLQMRGRAPDLSAALAEAQVQVVRSISIKNAGRPGPGARPSQTSRPPSNTDQTFQIVG